MAVTGRKALLMASSMTLFALSTSMRGFDHAGGFNIRLFALIAGTVGFAIFALIYFRAWRST